MTFCDFASLLENQIAPVVLLEGTRSVSEADFPVLETFAENLARQFPHAIFRSGNALGSDEAFARGVAKISATRLEIVVPYARHRLSNRPENARVLSLDRIENTDELERLSLEATPDYKWLASQKDKPQLAAKWKYLLRDTLKISGAPDLGFAPATVGLFFINTQKKAGSGGTGHTLRVCQTRGVAVAAQSEWGAWGLS